MATNLVIEIGDEILNSMANGSTVTVRIVRGGAAAKSSPESPGTRGARYRKGSLPQRLIDWAANRGGEFETGDVVDALDVSRSHASMLLNKVVHDAGPVRRVARGVYALDATPPAKKSKPAKQPAKKK